MMAWAGCRPAAEPAPRPEQTSPATAPTEPGQGESAAEAESLPAKPVVPPAAPAEEKAPSAISPPPARPPVEAAPAPSPRPVPQATEAEPGTAPQAETPLATEEPDVSPNDGKNLEMTPEQRKAWEQELAEAERQRHEAQKKAIAALGPPLVENPERLQKLDPFFPLWLDPTQKRVILVGEVAQQRTPLEMFACLRGTKEHESVVVVDTKAFLVHAALLALGAKAGHPVQYSPEYVPASGTEIEIEVVWKDRDGKSRRGRAQDWVRDVDTGKALQYNWVFAGSGFWEDETTGQRHYQAEGGDFICVSNFPSAMLDLPVESSQSNNALLFEGFAERIPPRGTPVTVILKPKLDASKK